MSYICEKCGKVVHIKYGRGRFCSRACANSRNFTEESKNKKSKSISKSEYFIELGNYNRVKYYENPKICKICGSIIPYELRNRKTCSDVCEKEVYKNRALQNGFGGLTKGCGKGKRGYYHGIRCDSTYELIFVIYCLDHNIHIKRNTKYFTYMRNDGTIHKYYPDFYIEDSQEFIEIKGLDTKYTYVKLKAVQHLGLKIKLLHKEELKEMFNYVSLKYDISCNINSNHLELLYDN